MKTVEVVFDIPIDDTFDYLPGELLPQIMPGVRVRVLFGKQKKTGFVISMRERPDEQAGEYREIIAVHDAQPPVTSELLSVAGFMKERYFSSFGQALFSMIGTLPLKYRDCGKPESPMPSVRPSEGAGFSKKYLLFSRSSARYGTYEGIIDSIKEGSVLFLFPEVSMAEEFHECMREKYGRRAVLFHGGLKNKEKGERWFGMLNGKDLIVTGTRLAVFAPLRDCRAVVVDNGHNPSYREQQTPKYDASEIAEFRCRNLNVPIMIGEECLSAGQYFSVAAGDAVIDCVNGAEQPAVLITGMTRTSADRHISFLTRDAVSMLEETVLGRGKVAIAHNRKGSSKVLKCEKCESGFPCGSCGAGMVLSEDGKSLLCRFCRTSAAFEKKCPSCGSRKIGVRLFGIEKMYRMLKDQYPELKIHRYTAETGAVEEDFDVIVGTGIIKRLLRKHSIRLVIFVSGESFLNTPEYRSEENFFIMVNEMRSSMQDASGRILIQSRNPNLDIYKGLRENKPEIFYDRELGIRKQLGYPPFAEIVKVEVKGRKKDVIQRRQEAVEAYLREREVEIVYSGPSFPPVKKGRDVWKYLFRVSEDFDREEFRRMAHECGVTAESNPDQI